MKVIIAGGRDFNNYALLVSEVSRILLSIPSMELNPLEIVSGTARGADKLGEYYAIENKFPIKRFYPNWEKHGALAGPIRNKDMAQYASPGGILIAFWDGVSRGTKNMIKEAKAAGLTVHVINY